MSLPDELPERIYLLAVDRRKQRLVARDRLRYALRGAALAELLLAGAVRDVSGRVEVVRGVETVGLTAAVLAELQESARPRSWRHWVGARGRHARPEVRDRLVRGRFITVRRDRVLGLFPIEHIDVKDVAAIQRRRTTIRAALRGSVPASRIDARDAAAVAIAAVAEVGTVADRGERRHHKDRIEALGAEIAPVVKAIRQRIRSDRAAAASAGSAGGG